MSRVCKEFQPEKQPEDPPSHAHGHQTLPLRLLRQGVPQELRPEEALIDSQFGCIDVPSTTRDTCAWYRGRSAARDVLVGAWIDCEKSRYRARDILFYRALLFASFDFETNYKGISKGFHVEIGEGRAKE